VSLIGYHEDKATKDTKNTKSNTAETCEDAEAPRRWGFASDGARGALVARTTLIN